MFQNQFSFVWILLGSVGFLVGINTSGSAAEHKKYSYEKTIKPFLIKHCYDCHSGVEPEGDLNFKTLSTDFGQDKIANRWVDVLHSLQFSEMPPREVEQPNPIDKANVIGWVFQKMDQSNRSEAYRRKLLAPGYGNWVSHEKLFSGKIKTLPFSPSRLWRFSPEIFSAKGLHNAQSPYSYVTSSTGIRDYSSMSNVDQSTIQMILINTGQWLDWREQKGQFKKFLEDSTSLEDKNLNETVRHEFQGVIGRFPNEQEQAKYVTFLKKNIADGGPREGLRTTIKAMFLSSEAIYRMEFGLSKPDKHGRRHLSQEEIAYAIAYALTNHGPERRREIQDALHHGNLKTKEDVARVVKEILDKDIVGNNLPRIMRFFEEYFGYTRAKGVFKDSTRVNQEGIRQWNTGRLVYEAQQIIEHHLKQDKNVITELLTTDRYFIAHPGDNEVAREIYDREIAEIQREDYIDLKIKQKHEYYKKRNRDPEGELEKKEIERLIRDSKAKQKQVKEALSAGIVPFPRWPYERGIRGLGDLLYIEPYNLPSSRREEKLRWSWVIEQPMKMPKNQRAGLLTHPAWLAAHSLNDGNDPIHRGIWIQQKLLAGIIQDVPPDVDANIGEDPHKTLRERLEPLRNENCWRCHQKMNPLGEPFEIFDDWGRYRTEIYFDENNEIFHRRDGDFDRKIKAGKLTTRPVVATGAIVGSGDPNIDGEVNDAVEMMQRLGKSSRVRQSFIRHLFRYLMGRNEMLSDSATLIEAEKAYLKNNGSFKALVISLLSSDSFLYRK